ncbi:MAG: helix-turn-helix domain-containing protein [Desulforhopalus sp.]|nr:helix-turn-helix domain-containing protein [Desulforhopalus sp.]
MTDHPLPGPMSMVHVDGAKIKRLREEQGLTQLYLATAVHVTTDTISRWENRRYPSIKKENGIKLAEALNVQLADILENEIIAEIAAPPPQSTASQPLSAEKQKSGIYKVWPLLMLSLTLLGVFATFAWFSLSSSPRLVITAERSAPEHCIAGQSFPVLIRITGGPADKATAVVIRENLPANATVLKISPEISGGSKKKDTIKWLKKINETAVFAYVISVNGGKDEQIGFHGTAAISGDPNTAPPIGGSSSVRIGHHHWADTDKDNTISDSEILAVHDRYNEIEGINLDINMIEKMWLGSGYKWNESTQMIEILK